MHKRIFFGGVHPPTHKSITKDKPIKQASLPKRITLPLYRQIGKPSKAIVRPGDYVQVGTKVAQAEGFISSSVHSPVSGKVAGIEPANHPILGKSVSVIIESDGRQEICAGILQKAPLLDIDSLSPEKIIEAITEAGIVGMGGACFPTHVKLSPAKGKKIDTLIINGAECEPYLTCDHRLMLERPKDILTGVLILCKALRVKNCIIAIEDNKPDAIEAIRSVILSEAKNLASDSSGRSFGPQNDMCCVVSLPTKYPQGGEKQLIKTLLAKEVPSA